MRNFGLPEVRNKLKAPKMKPPKKEWEEEFEDEIMDLTEMSETICLLNKNIVTDLIIKYINKFSYNKEYDETVKVKIKARKGAILIERIKE